MTYMEMTKQEICRSYLTAVSKPKQIRILAELNGTNRETIMKILSDSGYYVTKKKEEKPKKNLKPKRKVKSARMLYDRLDELDVIIRCLEKQKAEYEHQYALIAEYLQKGGSYAGIQSYFR